MYLKDKNRKFSEERTNRISDIFYNVQFHNDNNAKV